MLTFTVMWQGGWVVVVARDEVAAIQILISELDTWNF